MFLGKITSNYQKYCLNAVSTLLFSLIGMLLFSQQSAFAVNTSIAITGNATINQATPTKDGTNFFALLMLMSKPIVIPAMNFTFLVALKTPLFLVQIL